MSRAKTARELSGGRRVSRCYEGRIGYEKGQGEGSNIEIWKRRPVSIPLWLGPRAT